jgi:hypothetical protein
MRYLALVALILTLAGIAPASADFDKPEQVVTTLYEAYGIGPNSGKTGLDDKLAQQIFTPGLLKLFRRAVDSGAMDADFYVNGQDFDLVKPVEITKVTVTGQNARVAATLTQNAVNNKGKPVVKIDKYSFALVKMNDGWHLRDAFNHGDSFTSVLAAVIKLGKKNK